MSPKFYWFLWVLFAVSAGVLWLGGVFTLLTVVIFGFITFGLTFMGMMCVLPGVVSHPPVKNAEIPAPNRASASPSKPAKAANGFTKYRSA